MSSSSDIQKGWREEKRSAYLYEVLARVEGGTPRQVLFEKLSAEAERQALFWVQLAKKKGATLPDRYDPDLRARMVVWIVKQFGPMRVRPILAAMKVRGISIYSKTDTDVTAHPLEMEPWHRAASSGGALRAGIFGINDGLVSNASLIMGVAGAAVDPQFILLSGTAGLLAGAFSMASGEYISMKSQREMFEYQIGLEREELKEYPEAEASELAYIYEAKGIPAAEAKKMAEKLIADPEKALDTLAREELGLNPDQLGSPWGAAISSFVSFTIGASVPLWPFVFSAGARSVFVSAGLTAMTLFVVGAVLSLYTGRRAVWSGLRMLLIGAAAGTVTFLLGRLLGVAIS